MYHYFIVDKNRIKDKLRNGFFKNASLEVIFNKVVPDETDVTEDDYDYRGIITEDVETLKAVRDFLPDAKELTEAEYNQAKADAIASSPVGIVQKPFTRQSVVGEPEGRRFRGTSILEEEIPAKSSGDFEEFTYDYTLAADREIDGVRFKAYSGDWRNTVTLQVVAPDDTILDEFVSGWHLDEPAVIKVYRAKLLAGLKIRLKITNYAATPFNLWVDAFLHSLPS